MLGDLLPQLKEANEFANNWVEPIPPKGILIPMGGKLWISNGNGAFESIGNLSPLDEFELLVSISGNSVVASMIINEGKCYDDTNT